MEKEIVQKLSEIEELLLKQLDNPEIDLGLMSGKAGILLFLMLQSKKKQSLKKYLDIFLSVEEPKSKYVYPTFSSGPQGFGWLVNFLNRKFGAPLQKLDIIDEFAYLMAKNSYDQNNLDFLHGMLGCIVYFLSSSGNTRQIGELLKLLEEKVETSEVGLFWRDLSDEQKKLHSVMDLGLAHGQSSFIVVLAKIAKYDISLTNRSLILLEGVIKFLLSFRTEKQEKYQFPGKIIDSVPKEHLRLSWCYGDLGIGSSIYRTGKILNNDTYVNQGIEILLQTTKLKYSDQSSLDCSLCHGFCSLIQIYHRLFLETQILEFKLARDYWLQEMLSRSKGSDLAGFYFDGGPPYSLLGGLTGVGLTLYSVLRSDSREFSWDEILLIS